MRIDFRNMFVGKKDGFKFKPLTKLKETFNFIKISFFVMTIKMLTKNSHIGIILIFLLINNFYLSQSIFPFKKGEMWGYMDTTGKVMIEPQYPMAGFFSEGMAYVQIGEALGYINTSGEVVIPSEYPAATNFQEGYASVMIDEDWMIINTSGEIVMESYFAKPMLFKNGLSKFKLEMGLRSKYGFIDTRGDTVIYPQFEMASDFSEGLCMASPDGRTYGYINTKGEWVIQPEFELGALMKINDEYDFEDKDFSDGLAAVQKGEKYGVIDKTGKQILDYKYEFIGKFGYGLAPAKKGQKYGFINQKGKWVIKPKYSTAEKFHNGLAAVSTGSIFEGKYGFINTKGKVAIPLKIAGYYSLYEPMHFWNGFVPCYIEPGVFGYLDRKGKVIWKMEKEE